MSKIPQDLDLLDLIKTTRVFCTPAGEAYIVMDYDGVVSTTAHAQFNAHHFRSLVAQAQMLGFADMWVLGYGRAFLRIWDDIWPTRWPDNDDERRRALVDMKRYHGVEFYELTALLGVNEPMDLCTHAGRTWYTEDETQRYFGRFSNATVSFSEFILCTGVHTKNWEAAEAAPLSPPWNDWQDAVGRTRSILVTSTDTLSYKEG